MADKPKITRRSAPSAARKAESRLRARLRAVVGDMDLSKLFDEIRPQIVEVTARAAGDTVIDRQLAMIAIRELPTRIAAALAEASSNG